MLTIIETSANHLYRITPTNDPALSHVWIGVEVKMVRGRYIDKKNARATLVRIAASRIVTNKGEA